MRVRQEDVQVLRWADIMRAWRLAGLVDSFSIADSMKAAAMLKQLIAEGKVVRVKRGRYRVPY